MSICYQASVTITKSNPKHEIAITKALKDLWGFEDIGVFSDEIFAETENSLGGGMSRDEFADILAQCVWTANQGFCKVLISMTCLEHLPSVDYLFSAQDKTAEKARLVEEISLKTELTTTISTIELTIAFLKERGKQWSSAITPLERALKELR